MRLPINKKRSIILITVFLFVILTAVALWPNPAPEQQSRACFRDHCFSVELTRTPHEKSRGLMFRTKLDEDKGMLFIFEEEGEYAFWMKNTIIPLDMIWINKEGEVVFIAENVRPCPETGLCPSIVSDKDAIYVLEVNGGLAKKIGLKIGDKAILEINR